MRLILNSASACLLGFLILSVVSAQPAAAQTCDDSTRAAFEADVANGASDSELEAKYGQCRNFTEATCTKPATTIISQTGASDFMEVQSVQNANTFWERMNGCGYHPQAEVVACDVEIRRTTGYGAFPGGTFEHVRFCLDCDRNGTWDFNTLGFVHVTDNVAPLPTPSWYHLAFATTFAAPVACTANNGGQMNLRTILSWSALPPPCTNGQQTLFPVFGNVFTETVRRDP
jgi:hypothetical protein